MPTFNEFRINEDLLAEIREAKKNVDLTLTKEESNEVDKLIKEFQLKEIEKKKSLLLRVYEKLFGKKLMRDKDNNGFLTIRQYDPEYSYKPELKVSVTIERPIDFGDEIDEWRKQLKLESILSEERELEKVENEKTHKKLILIYSSFIERQMMKTY